MSATPSVAIESSVQKPTQPGDQQIVRGALEGSHSVRLALDHGLFDVQPERWLRRVPGRETFTWQSLPSIPAVIVKRTFGDQRRDLWYERLHRGRARCPGRREYENLQELRAAGVQVPEALAWAADIKKGRSLVVMEQVSHDETLRQALEELDPVQIRRRLTELAALVLRLHRAGWYHRDLYLEHILMAPQPGAAVDLVLIDVGRARCERSPRRRWFEKDLAALAHSTPDCIPLRTRLRFLVLWLNGMGVSGRRVRRKWVRAIEARRTRMAAHVPRHGEAPNSTAVEGSGRQA